MTNLQRRIIFIRRARSANRASQHANSAQQRTRPTPPQTNSSEWHDIDSDSDSDSSSSDSVAIPTPTESSDIFGVASSTTSRNYPNNNRHSQTTPLSLLRNDPRLSIDYIPPPMNLLPGETPADYECDIPPHPDDARTSILRNPRLRHILAERATVRRLPSLAEVRGMVTSEQGQAMWWERCRHRSLGGDRSRNKGSKEGGLRLYLRWRRDGVEVLEEGEEDDGEKKTESRPEKTPASESESKPEKEREGTPESKESEQGPVKGYGEEQGKGEDRSEGSESPLCSDEETINLYGTEVPVGKKK